MITGYLATFIIKISSDHMPYYQTFAF